MNKEALAAAISAKFPDVTVDVATPFAEAKVPAASFRAFAEWLKGDAAMAFDYPMSQTAVDWPEEKKITSVYHLYSMAHKSTLVVKVDLDRADPKVATVCDLWRGCEWFERETYDMFGVVFVGHPDLRRIMLTDDWVGWPLRKDYKDSRIAGKPY